MFKDRLGLCRRYKKIVLCLVLLSMGTLFAGGEEIGRGALLRHHITDNTLLYLRLPELFTGGLLAEEKANKPFKVLEENSTYKTAAKAMRETLFDHEKVTQLLERRLGVSAGYKFAPFITFLSRMNTPLEVMVEGTTPDNLAVKFTVGLTFSSMAELNALLTHNEYSAFLPPFAENGTNELGFLSLKYDLTTQRLYGLANTSPTIITEREVWQETLQKSPILSHKMSEIEAEIDTSGQGFLFWLPALGEESGMMLEVLSYEFEWGGWTQALLPFLYHPDFKGLALGIGKTVDNRRQTTFHFAGKTEKLLGYRGSSMAKKTNIAFKTIGEPDYLLYFTLPSLAELKKLENHILNYFDVDDQEAYRVGKETFLKEMNKELGFDIALFYEPLGPELLLYKDKSGVNYAYRIRDKKGYEEMLEAYQRLSIRGEDQPLSPKKTNKNKALYHFALDNQKSYLELLDTVFNVADNEWRDNIIMARFFLSRWLDFGVLNSLLTPVSHLYIQTEGDWSVMNYLPQPLLARKEAKFSLDEWFEKIEFKPQDSWLGVAVPTYEPYERYYYNFLKRLQTFADDLEVTLDLTELPLASDLKTPEKEGVYFSWDWTEDRVGVTYRYALAPTDINKGYFGTYMSLYTIGIVAALTIPSYQDYSDRAKIRQGLLDITKLKSLMEIYYLEYGEFPQDNAALGISDDWYFEETGRLGWVEIEGSYLYLYLDSSYNRALILEAYPISLSGIDPSYQEDNEGYAEIIEWDCYSYDYPNRVLPSQCQW